VPYSAREGPEPEWASQKGQRMATLSRGAESVDSGAVPASPNTHLLRLSMRAWRAFTAGRSGRACGRGRIRLATGEAPSGPGQYRASSLYCEGNISGGTGGRAGGARWAVGGRRRERVVRVALCLRCARVFVAAGFSGSELLGERPHQGPLVRIYGPPFPWAASQDGGASTGGGKGSPSSRGALGGGRGGEEDDCATHRCDAPERSATNLIGSHPSSRSQPASEQYPAVGSAAVRHQCSGIPEGGHADGPPMAGGGQTDEEEERRLRSTPPEFVAILRTA
jgi:hypothetical protein